MYRSHIYLGTFYLSFIPAYFKDMADINTFIESRTNKGETLDFLHTSLREIKDTRTFWIHFLSHFNVNAGELCRSFAYSNTKKIANNLFSLGLQIYTLTHHSTADRGNSINSANLRKELDCINKTIIVSDKAYRFTLVMPGGKTLNFSHLLDHKTNVGLKAKGIWSLILHTPFQIDSEAPDDLLDKFKLFVFQSLIELRKIQHLIDVRILQILLKCEHFFLQINKNTEGWIAFDTWPRPPTNHRTIKFGWQEPSRSISLGVLHG